MLGLYSTMAQESEDKIAAWAGHWSVNMDFGFRFLKYPLTNIRVPLFTPFSAFHQFPS